MKKTMKSKETKKRVLASTVALALLVTGTFAWQSFSQLATNEIIENVDPPGGRLHDYFNGTDKNVFVENYGSGDNVPEVYARIRISEYMEYGKDAGSDDAIVANLTIARGDIQHDTPIIGYPDTWDIYDHAATVAGTSGDIREFRSLELGGAGVYMPTFNQDNTDTDPEVKGTYRDDLGDVKETPYDDYKSYTAGDVENGYLITADGTATDETPHTAKDTAEATIMTMKDWLDLDIKEQVGDYWVFDTTGWAYYAKPIPGATASGLLLDGIKIESNPKDEWYYAVDVIAQLCTFGDWGEEPTTEGGTDGTGMYGDMTEDSMSFLDIIANGPYVPTVTKINITAADGEQLSAEDKILEMGTSISLASNVTVANEDGTDEEKAVTWSVSEVGITRTASGLSDEELQATMDDGTFTPVLAMGGYTYRLTATSEFTSGVSGSVEIAVNEGRVIITAAGDATTVDPGASLQFSASNPVYTNQAVTWSVDDTVAAGTAINASGLLTVSAVQLAGTEIVVSAVSQEDAHLVGSYTVTVNTGTVIITAAGDATTVKSNATLQYSALVTGVSDQGVKWEIIGDVSDGTSISDTGLLTVDIAETNKNSIIVQATSTADTDLTATKSVEVQKIVPGTTKTVAEVQALAGTTTPLSVNGINFYVLSSGTFSSKTAVKLLHATSTGTTSKFGSNNTYSGSTVQTAVLSWYNNTFLPGGWLTDSDVCYEGTTTRSTGTPTITTSDKAFLLSSDEADALSTTIRATGSAYWLRTPYSSTSYNAYYVDLDGTVNGYGVSTSYAVRPALWIYL